MDNCLLKSAIERRFVNDHGISQIQAYYDDEKVRNCPLCGGMKYIQKTNPQGYRTVSPCPGQFVLNRIDAYNKAKIPARFMDCTLDNYILDYLNESSTVRSFISSIRNFKPGDRGVLLEGGPGTGKTHLLCGAIRYLTLELGISCQYIDYSILLSEIRASYGQNISESFHVDPLTEIPVLFIDELGKGRDKANDFEIRIIDDIINRRYLNPELTTLFASNYRDRDTSGYNGYLANGYNIESKTPMSSSTWAQFSRRRWKVEGFASEEDFLEHVRQMMKREHIEDRISERTASRILEMAGPIFIDASDCRRRKRNDK